MIEQYKEACALMAKTSRRISKLEDQLRDAHKEHQTANDRVTDAGIKLRTQLGVGNYKLGKLILVITPSTVQIQELKNLEKVH